MSILPRFLSVIATAVVATALVACGPLAFQANSSLLSPTDVNQLALQIDPALDPKVDAGSLRLMLSNNTLITRSLSDPAQVQYGFFEASGDLVINARPGAIAYGSWELQPNGICYQLDSGRFCSSVHSVTILKGGRTSQVYYFARASTGEPTVVFTGILGGFAIPGDRIPAAATSN